MNPYVVAHINGVIRRRRPLVPCAYGFVICVVLLTLITSSLVLLGSAMFPTCTWTTDNGTRTWTIESSGFCSSAGCYQPNINCQWNASIEGDARRHSFSFPACRTAMRSKGMSAIVSLCYFLALSLQTWSGMDEGRFRRLYCVASMMLYCMTGGAICVLVFIKCPSGCTHCIADNCQDVQTEYGFGWTSIWLGLPAILFSLITMIGRCRRP